ncbi:MAG: hypothetical protein COU90_00190 [Candidatus Ryanbacteria bacterium CG10_big_fil_rev_8_21_14_0_10_43_42]|uniref:YdbS-like PH domain-containing protein n=1 Tax=Candidatus Ryanbacteria bacterium CG10_big_fil_rev_8_21_14_0_10_43_42 TaxID=1974864 RepID=A0A2M8KYE8_9BACT|nr:MAG: hypothetical protein COU90_00190 [Candidatus Ryanbacteria bacterium CG10_big_fil_rev_8_21_14_0_10_43_42]
MKQLDPKAVWLLFISGLLRFFAITLFLTFFFGSILIDAFKVDTAWITSSYFLISFAVLILFLVVVWIWARLSYHFYRYEFTEEGFRKEFGIVWKKYVTIPYDRIQNVDIYRGIVARALGLSDLHIQTAGASAQYSRYGALGLSAEGRLPGLSKEVAEQVRDELIHRARGSKSQGL